MESVVYISPIAYSELVYLFPQRFAISSVLYRSTDGYTGKLRTGFSLFLPILLFPYLFLYCVLPMSVFLRHLKRMPDNILPDRIPCGGPKEIIVIMIRTNAGYLNMFRLHTVCATIADGWLPTNQYAILLLYGQSDSYQTPPHKKLDKLHPLLQKPPMKYWDRCKL